MEYYKEANKFSNQYGMDAFKIIAAYEDAADIPQNERYAGWYGDYGIFEPSLNEEMTYQRQARNQLNGSGCNSPDF